MHEAKSRNSRRARAQRPASSPRGPFVFRELSPATWRDFETLMGGRGAECSGCWCMWWRERRPARLTKSFLGDANRDAMRGLVAEGRAKGLLAYAGREPVAWCTFGPRSHFPRLERFAAYRRPGASGAWALPCFYVRKDWRGKGLSALLLREAEEAARRGGARELEGYPAVPKASGGRLPDLFAWTGAASLFAEAGFVEVQRLRPRRPLWVKRLDGGGSERDLRTRILDAYRPGSFGAYVPPERLRRCYREWGLDPRTLAPGVFDLEARSCFLQEGLLALFDRLEISPKHRVLSLGEGNGAPSRLLVKRVGCRVTGVDINPAAVADARRIAPWHGVEEHVEYLCQDAQRLRLGGRRYDRLCISESMCHWWEKGRALSAALRHLRPGALIGINDWLAGDLGGLRDSCRPADAADGLFDPRVWFQSSLAEICALLRARGCEILESSDLTDEVDARLRRKAKEGSGARGSAAGRGSPDPRLAFILGNHYRYLRYGRIVARAP